MNNHESTSIRYDNYRKIILSLSCSKFHHEASELYEIISEEPPVYYQDKFQPIAFAAFGAAAAEGSESSSDNPRIRDSFPESWIFDDFPEYVTKFFVAGFGFCSYVSLLL